VPLTGPQQIDQFVGEDVVVVVTFAADVDVTGGLFGFVLAPTLAEALAGTAALVTKSVGDGVTVNTATQVTVDLTGGASAGLSGGEYQFVLRRTDAPDRAVVAWGPWLVLD
jgi:hypothetical protein